MDPEWKNGCRLEIEIWEDTSCYGKHALAEDFMVDKTVTVTGFTSSLGALKDIHTVNFLYTYDTTDGKTLLMEHNNTIFIG